LDVMASSAKDLKEVMDLLIKDGVSDQFLMQRVEKLSDDVLLNLVKRITEELVSRDGSQVIIDEILAIARDLDAVRAVKASIAITQQVDTIKLRMAAQREQQAAGQIPQLKAALQGITQPKQLLLGTTRVLELVDKIHEVAPDSKKIADALLQSLIALANRILAMQPGWVIDVQAAVDVKEISGRVDAIAEKLVAVVASKWDPPMLGQVEYIFMSQAKQTAAEKLAAAEKHLAASKAGMAFDALEALLPWWPHLKDIGAISLQAFSVFSKVQTYATETFIKATTSGDKATADAIKEFADKFDKLRESFEGLPEGGRQLSDSIKAGEVAAEVTRNLAILDKEVAKTTDGDKSTNLSLASCMQALEHLTALWPRVDEKDGALAGRMEKSCEAVENWAEKASMACAVAKVDSLLKFAQEYDKRRQQFDPPAPKKGALAPRIATHAASMHLKTVEAELAKPVAMNPNVLLGGLEDAAKAMPKAAATREFQSRLAAAFAATEKRAMEKYREAMSAGDSRRQSSLQVFAVKFDALRVECSCGGAGEWDSGLADQFRDVASGATRQHLTTIETELAKSSNVNLTLVLSSLRALETLWPKVPEGSDLHPRFHATVGNLEEKLLGLVALASERNDSGTAGKLLQIAGDMDSAIAAMGVEKPPGVGAFRIELLGPVVDVHVRAARKCLEAFEVANCKQLEQELVKVHALCQEEGCPADVQQGLVDLVLTLEAPLLHALARAPTPGDEMSCLAVTKAADGVYEAAKGPARGDALQKRCQGYLPVAAKLREVRREVAKPSGMNPKIVLQGLEALHPDWGHVADVDAFRDALKDALEQFHVRLTDACQKAIGEDERKLKALLEFASHVDRTQETLTKSSTASNVGSAHQKLAHFIVSRRLETMEAELVKTSGFNPAMLVKIIQKDIAPVWPALGELCEERGRVLGVHEKVRLRMEDSMRESIAAGNSKKRDALLKFASDFDTACGHLVGLELPGNIHSSLDELALSRAVSTCEASPAESRA